MSSLDLYSLFVSTLPVTWNLKGNHVDMYYISGNLLRYLSIWVYIGRGSHHPNSSTYVHCKKIVFKNLCLKRNLKTIKKNRR